MEEEAFGPEITAVDNSTEDFGPQEKISTVSVTQRAKEKDKVFMSTLLGVEPTVIEAEIDTGATQRLNSAAMSTVEQNKQKIVNEALSLQERQAEANKVLTQVAEEISGMDTISRFVSPATIAMISSSDSIERSYAIGKVKRLFMAQSIIQDRIKEAAPEGFWEWVTNGDFVDYALSSPLNLIASKRNKEYADRFSSLLYSNVSDDEFEANLDSMLKEMSDFGLFTEANRFYLADFLHIIGSGSESEQAKIQTALATFDTITGGVPLAIGGVKYVASGGAMRTARYAGMVGRGAVGVAHGIVTDAARLVGYVKADPNLVNKILTKVITIDDPTNATSVLGNHTVVSAGTPTFMRGEYLSAVSQQAMRIFEDTSEAFIQAKKMLAQAGEAIDEELLNNKMTQIVADRKAAHLQSKNARFIDTDFEIDDFENIFVTDILGAKSGTNFKGQSGLRAAERLADDVGGEVRSVGPNEYAVFKSHNIPQEIRNFSIEDMYLWLETDAADLGYGNLVEYLGSPLSQTTSRLNSILKQSEAAREEWAFRMQKELSSISKQMPRAEEKEVWAMFEELNNGKFASQRTGFTRKQFEQEFYNKFSKKPTNSQTALYLKHQEYLDVDVLLNADTIFKRQVSDGVIVLNNDWRVVQKTSSEVPANAMIWDDDLQKAVPSSSLNPDQIVYQLYDPVEQSFASNLRYYKSNSATTRRLYHSDVMQRNSGGPRIYKRGEAGFYIKQEREYVFGDGTSTKISPLTIMTTRLEAEAATVVAQVNKIVDEIKAVLGNQVFNTNDELLLALNGQKNNARLNQIISDNSAWFSDIKSVDALIDFSKKYGLDLRKGVERVADGEAIIDASTAGHTAGMSYGSALRSNGYKSASRRDEVLVGFGGEKNKLRTVPAKEAIQRKLSEGIATASDRAYMSASINGLLKSAIENGVLENIGELGNLTLRQKLERAKIRSSTVVGKKLALEQRKIMFRLNRSSVTQRAYDNLTLNLSNFLYEKNYRKAADWVANRSTDPFTALRGYVFDAKLGLFAYDQLYVQSSQVLNIMAIAEGNAGLVGSGLYGPVRFALINGNDNVILHLGDSLSGVTGLSGQQFLEMVTMLRNSGRTRANVSFAEFGEDASAASMGLKDLRNAGRVFFKEGELVSRISGWNTAYLEYVRKFPNNLPSSQHGKRWISNRTDVLTQAMTSSSRAVMEQLPFMQFLSYTLRVNEAIFSGSFGGKGRKILTAKEKMKLAAVHTVMFGAAGWTVPSVVMDRIQHLYGIPVEEDTYRFIRKGLIDGIVSMATGVDTSISSRLGTNDTMFMMMQDFADQSMVEFFMGPSGTLAKDMFSIIVGTATHIGTGVASGDFKLLQEDFEKLMRITKTGNTAYNSYKAFKYNEYLTKSGALIDKNVTYQEAMAIALGVPIERIENSWKYITQKKMDKFFLAKDVENIQVAYNNYAEAIRREDYEEMRSWAKVIGTLYSSLSPQEFEEVDRQIRKKGTPITDEMLLKALRTGSGFAEGMK